MTLDKLLIVNDDTDVIVAMKERIPDSIKVEAASQFGAKCLNDYSAFGLILLDNDANDLQESKGAETLAEIRKKSDIPVIYTSFQPSMVPEQVYKTKGVQVIRTEKALDHLAREHGFELKPKKERSLAEPQTSLIITYNPVDGYESGVYGSGKLLIASNMKYAERLAPQVVAEHIRKLYSDFSWATDREKIKNIFIYDGINGRKSPGNAAAGLGHDIRMNVNLMACRCDWERKQQFANSTYVDLYQVSCGGSFELGMIADVILGIKRPGRDYSGLVIPEAKILAPAERWAI